MDFTEIQQRWTAQTVEKADMDAAVWEDVMRRAGQISRRVRVRDSIELVTALGLSVLFGWIATQAPVPWPWVGAALIVMVVGGVFVRERWRSVSRSPAPTDLRRSLERALQDVEHQMQLLGSVAIWYLAPLAVAVLLVLVGTVLGAKAELGPDVWARTRLGLIGVAVAMVPVIGALFAGIWWLNRRAVVAQLMPQRDHLVDVLQQLTTGHEFTRGEDE